MLYLACPAPFSACRRQGGGRAAGTKHQARQGAAGGRGHQPGRVACRTGQSVGTFMRGMPCETARERSQLTTPGGPWKGRDAGRILTHCVASARLPPPTRRHRLRTHPDAHQPWRGARRQRACGLTHVTGGADGTARSCEERCAGSANRAAGMLAGRHNRQLANVYRRRGTRSNATTTRRQQLPITSSQSHVGLAHRGDQRPAVLPLNSEVPEPGAVCRHHRFHLLLQDACNSSRASSRRCSKPEDFRQTKRAESGKESSQHPTTSHAASSPDSPSRPPGLV